MGVRRLRKAVGSLPVLHTLHQKGHVFGHVLDGLDALLIGRDVLLVVAVHVIPVGGGDGGLALPTSDAAPDVPVADNELLALDAVLLRCEYSR